MPVIRSAPAVYTARSAVLPEPEESDIWFDASAHMDETWFNYDETNSAQSASPLQKAEEHVPLTEDCRRCAIQLLNYLGVIKEAELISAGIAQLLPGAPTELIIAADSLYIAVTQGKNIDLALLNTLGLAASLLPADANTIAQLARFIRNSVQEYIGECFPGSYLSENDSSPASAIFTALSVLAVVTRYWITDDMAPQRRLLRLPIFVGNLLIRANVYWNQLGRMAKRALPLRPLLLGQKNYGPAGIINRERKTERLRSSASDPRELTVRSSEPRNQQAVIVPLMTSVAVATTVSMRDPTPRSNLLLVTASSVATLGLFVGGKFILKAFYPPAAAGNSSAITKKKRSPPESSARWLPAKKPLITPAPPEIKIEKLYDFSCLNTRAELSWSDIIGTIGDTISYPIRSLTEESQIIHSHNTLRQGCPLTGISDQMNELTGRIDAVITQIVTLLPGSQPVAIAQMIVGPALKMLADDMAGKPRDITQLDMINNQLLYMARQTIPTLDSGERKKMMKADNSARNEPKQTMSLDNGKISITIENKNMELYEDVNFSPYVNQKDKKYVYYDLTSKKWKYLPDTEQEKYSSENLLKIKNEKIADETQLDAERITLVRNDFFNYMRPDNTLDHYITMNGYIVKANPHKILKEKVMTSTASGIINRIILHGESGYYFESGSTPMSADLEKIISAESFCFSSGEGKTFIKADGYSYDSIQNKYIKHEDNYYRVATDPQGSHLETTYGKRFYLEREGASFSTFKTSLADNNEFRNLPDGKVITISLYAKLVDEGKKSVPGKIVEKNNSFLIDENGKPFLYIEGDFYEMRKNNDKNSKLAFVKNSDNSKPDIPVYENNNDLLIGKNEEKKTSSYSKETSCIVRRSPSTSSSCASVFISKYILNLLNKDYNVNVNEQHLVIYKDFPNTFKNKANGKLYYKQTGMYFRAEIIPPEESMLKITTLRLILKNHYGLFSKKEELCRLVSTNDGPHDFINTEDEEFLLRIEATPQAAHAYLTGKVGIKHDVQQCVFRMYKKEKFIPVSFGENNPPPVSDNDIRYKIRKRFFRGAINWSTISLQAVDENQTHRLRSAAHAMKQGVNHAVDVLDHAINELERRSDNAINYLSISLGTKNRRFIINFCDVLASKLSDMRAWVENSEVILCYTHRKKDFFIDRDQKNQHREGVSAEIILPPGSIEKKKARVMAFTQPGKDKRIWVNLDAFYYLDLQNPDSALLKEPVVTPYMTILHEASHKKGMSRDITYVDYEDGDAIPILDALDNFAVNIEKLTFNDNQAFLTLVNNYLNSNDEYKNIARNKLINGRTLRFIFQNDLHFKAALLLNIADFLAIMSRDIYKNDHNI